MGNAYKVGRLRLTAMQNECYNYLKNNIKPQTIDSIIKGVYYCYPGHSCPDIWSYEEKVFNVSKWCSSLVHLGLLDKEGEKFKIK